MKWELGRGDCRFGLIVGSAKSELFKVHAGRQFRQDRASAFGTRHRHGQDLLGSRSGSVKNKSGSVRNRRWRVVSDSRTKRICFQLSEARWMHSIERLRESVCWWSWR